MKRARVLILQNIIAPYRIPLFDEIATRLRIDVLFLSQKPDDRKWSTELGRVSFAYKVLRRIKLGFFVLNPGLLAYLISHPFDAYVLADNEENLFSNLFTLLYAKVTRKPCVVWTGHIPITGATIHPIDLHHTVFHRWPIKDIYVSVTKRFNQFLYRSAMSYLAYSDYSRQYLVEAGVDARKIYVGTQAMSTDLLLPPTEEAASSSGRIKVLYLGYLRPEKGVDTLIKAFLELPPAKFELNIVGDGPEKERLRHLAATGRNISFYPNAPSKERATWFAYADISVLPSLFDAWAHTVTESLYYGVPVIASTSAAASTVIHPGINGFVVEAGDAEMLRGIMNKLTAASLAKMKESIHSSDQARLFDVAADADNFVQAIATAKRGKVPK